MRDEDILNADQASKNNKEKSSTGSRQVSEEKNKFALSVLRRVRVKLEGREPDSLRKVIIQNIPHSYPIALIFDMLWEYRVYYIVTLFLVLGWRASGFYNSGGNEYGKSGTNVRGMDRLDII